MAVFLSGLRRVSSEWFGRCSFFDSGGNLRKDDVSEEEFRIWSISHPNNYRKGEDRFKPDKWNPPLICPIRTHLKRALQKRFPGCRIYVRCIVLEGGTTADFLQALLNDRLFMDSAYDVTGALCGHNEWWTRTKKGLVFRGDATEHELNFRQFCFTLRSFTPRPFIICGPLNAEVWRCTEAVVPITTKYLMIARSLGVLCTDMSRLYGAMDRRDEQFRDKFHMKWSARSVNAFTNEYILGMEVQFALNPDDPLWTVRGGRGCLLGSSITWRRTSVIRRRRWIWMRPRVGI